MTFVDKAEALVRKWQEPGGFATHAASRREGLAEGPYRLAGFGCAKVGYQISGRISWSLETIQEFESILTRYGLRAEYGLYAHGKDPDGIEFLTVKDIGPENALYIDRRFPQRQQLLADLTSLFTRSATATVRESGPEVDSGLELVPAVEGFITELRNRGDFLPIAGLRNRGPRWQGIRFTSFA